MNSQEKLLQIKEKYEVGVIIGRFQIPELTPAHRFVLDTIASNHKKFVILIGTTNDTLFTKNNPLGYLEREQMLTALYPEAIINFIQDCPTNDEWSHNIDITIKALSPNGKVCLYGGRDSSLNSYTGKFNTFEINEICHISGTHERSEVGKNKPIASIDFRKGIIFATENKYPTIYPTVDVAIWRKQGKDTLIFVGRRKGRKKWRFTGGFVDITDLTLEDAAIREAIEETGFDLDASRIQYITSHTIPSSRYNGKSEKILTSFYAIPYTFGAYSPTDVEFEEVGWKPIRVEPTFLIEENHMPLYQALLKTKLK